MSADTNIKVVVRCRPLNSREHARGAKELIRMMGNQTFLDPPEHVGNAAKAIEKKTMAFSFDKSYWSAGPRDAPEYCSQQTLYDDLGKELLDHAFEGFNACILAYGQTGSGKSYSMMGYGLDKGIIPLTCEELFRRVVSKTSGNPNLSFTVEVSYMEIYNEKVRDLLNPKNSGNLKVREHPVMGPYVEDLAKLVVGSYDEMMTLMDEGNKARTVAATNMNETSSRSHAVFTLILTQKIHDEALNLDAEKASRISLVDLAGSERANSTGATGQRLKEGANINKSLTTLGKVIASLAVASEATGKGGKKKKVEEHIPYRDSVLTWLLKDSIGGNSKTAMIAAISPADYDETLSTLRYADQAKKIKNKAVVNEDPNAKLVRELKEELDLLRARVASSSAESTYDPTVPATQQMVTYQTATGEVKTISKADLQEQLEASEKLMKEVNETWEEKLERTKAIQQEREQALEELGITVERDMVGVHTPKRMPHLVNLNEDPLMSECLIYQLKPGKTMVGRLDSDKPAVIRLSGSGILNEHCLFENNEGKVTLLAMPDSMTMLNGNRISSDKPYRLRSGYRIILGDNHFFRFNNPEEVRKRRDRTKMHQSISAADLAAEGINGSPRPETPDSAAGDDVAEVDWTYAKREAALVHLNGQGEGFESLPDDDLNKLYHEISKVKNLREYAKSRPESSLSHVEEIWSDGRPPPSEITDDTSVEPNGGTSHGSPSMEDQPRDAQVHLEHQRAEFEERLNAMADTTQTEDLEIERDHMQLQLKLVQNQMKRLMELRKTGASTVDFVPMEPVLYSARQLRLIRKVLDKWRSHKSFSMAESVLSNAVIVKEANVLSKELDKAVSYNFTVLSGGSLSAPTSALEDIGALGEFGDVADPVLLSTKEPTVGIKVLDKRHTAVYIWSLDRLQQQLQRMRNLTSFIDRPSYSRHFSSEEPFYDRSPPHYSFIGNALVSLAPLSRRMSPAATIPIFCRYTAEAIGSCRVDARVLTVNTPARGAVNGSAMTSRSSSPLPEALPQGSKLSFTLTIDSVKGLSSLDFGSVHMQVRLSAFMGPSVAAEDVFPSTVIDMDNAPLYNLKLRRTFSFVLNAKVTAYMRQGYAPIEFFAEVKPSYIERLERWDEMREQHMQKELRSTRPAQMRRAETDFVVEERHDVVAWVQVRELTSSGEYQAVPVLSQGQLDSGVFLLRQGLQRRLALTLTCHSGKQMPWKQITRINAGKIRLLDAKGRLHDPSTADDRVDLKLLKPQTVDLKPDGSATLHAEASWDSSAHDSLLLNRVTGIRQRVLLQLDWMVEIDTCAEPALFTTDIAVDIQERDARPPSMLTGLFSSTKVLTKCSAIFSLRLTPQLSRSAKDMWRLDTSEKYVRGEEVLASWKPRGVSVVEDYIRLDNVERRAADVQAIKILLDASPTCGAMERTLSDEEATDLLRKTMDLWTRRSVPRPELQFKLVQEPSSPMEESEDIDQAPKPKLVAHTKLIARSDTATKKGHLSMLIDPAGNSWKRRWFVLRRPYLYIYAHSNELEELSVIALNGVNVEHSSQLAVLFDKPFTFTLFTASNSHALAAPNAKELQSWMIKLDPTRLPS
ncbi:kinesin-like protein [Dacryopinax primogenitus]|uniref:Kinesin-like protein n=1 Tax=Dacryopinax primogenitus (strain DJM 731) TaxID=1858805 RepID=M5GFC2_DACPD|nr:kinesin-like protein [Dacryopinax primogenitus]EJU06137.1 kinesin-like protein [Dacryopinax primogenitus]